MRIVDVRPGHEQEDIKNGKAILKSEIDHPAKSVAIIRGEDSETAQLADRVGTRADPFPWREAVWLKVSDSLVRQILTQKQYTKYFGSNLSAAVAVLDFADELSAHLGKDASLRDIDKAFLTAKG